MNNKYIDKIYIYRQNIFILKINYASKINE